MTLLLSDDNYKKIQECITNKHESSHIHSIIHIYYNKIVYNKKIYKHNPDLKKILSTVW